ncbi:ATPase family associated with various cellular activities (AAA) [Flavobacterium micromati]|jgi:mRNA-degrading endonuclease HigB of HigAB toxin-antitoxin module|uniref:ATPase family associated with various cellular activities (AAA) n=1 Tax=Flavobacterium micromati TaxID=229205 RepID=A0A1M5NCN1_9FLAO|nr:AAA family ATPase [Flavobacterium micromati]SHG87280.1 ATPase family associated with various cellular activities (AAA) [Flavobacterium micromati]
MENQNDEGKKLKIQNNSFHVYDNGSGYVNQLRMYHAYFSQIPNIKIIRDIDITAMRNHISAEMKENIEQVHYSQTYRPEKKKNFYADHFFILKNKIVINLSGGIFGGAVFVLFESSLEKEANDLQSNLLKFQLKPKKTTQISFIVSDEKGLSTKSIEVKKPKVNLDLHYNDDFKNIHQLIVKNLKKRDTKGLYLFYGLPGTGKSTYIKYLIHQQNKKVIFLSPKIAGNLDDMSFTKFILDNPNCVLVIEDAEDLILSRDNHHNSRLSFLLNLTDGLLADSLGIQVIATFNTDLKNIDMALLRKGRLTSIYNFKLLATDKTNVLLEKLGHDIVVKNSLSLADIFNFRTDLNYQSIARKAVGFGN